MSSQYWNAVIITGASRGFGECVAKAYASTLTEKSATSITPLHLVLTARTSSDLIAVKESIMEARGSILGDLLIDTVVSDLSDGASLEVLAHELFDKPFTRDQDTIPRVYNKVAFINNAGSLGPLQYIGSGEDWTQSASAFHVNISAALFLTAQLVYRYSGGKLPQTIKALEVVNISSLAAIQPFESWGYYCAGKAARDMFHRVIAAEHVNDGIIVLNYAPGPMDTNMQKEIRECVTVKQDVREYFASLKVENKLVDPMVSAKKLVRVLATGRFSSGSHVDFYDIVEGVDKPIDCTCSPTCSCDVASVCNCGKVTATTSSCGCTTCGCGESCNCGPGCSCGKSTTAAASASSCCCEEACNCGPDCSCGKAAAATIQSSCGCSTCGCGASCNCGPDCTCGKAAAAASTSSCCCEEACNCGTDCSCGKAAASTIVSSCGCTTCGCGESCQCGPDCSCGKGSTAAATTSSCGCSSKGCCGINCQCGSTCNCTSSTKDTFVPSCRAASVCTCGPTCDCKETMRPGCDPCRTFVSQVKNP